MAVTGSVVGFSPLYSEAVQRLTTCPFTNAPLLTAVQLLPCLHRISFVATEVLSSQNLCHICEAPVAGFHIDLKFRSIVHSLLEPHNEEEWIEIALSNWRWHGTTYPGVRGAFNQDPDEPLTFINQNPNAFISKFKIISGNKTITLEIYFAQFPQFSSAIQFWSSYCQYVQEATSKLSVSDAKIVKVLFTMIHEHNPLERKALCQGYRAIMAQIGCPSDHLTEKLAEVTLCPITKQDLTEASTCPLCARIVHPDALLDSRHCGICEKPTEFTTDLPIQDLVKEILKPLPDKVPAMAFGKAKWKRYFGAVGVEPPLPLHIEAVLKGPCPFWSDKRVEETHILVLIPRTVNGKLLTLRSLNELVQRPKQGRKAKFNCVTGEILTKYGDEPINKSRWVLMTKDVLPDTRERPYSDQNEILRSFEAPGYYGVPRMLDAAVAIFMTHVEQGLRLFSNDPATYTRCDESSSSLYYEKDYCLGYFNSLDSSLIAYSYKTDSRIVGLVAARIL